MTIREALTVGARRLAGHTCPGADAVRDAELLLAFATGRSKERVATEPEHALHLSERLRYLWLISRRRAHVPMAYLTGSAWFYGRRFTIRRGTLIPRPATETIVEAALAAAPEDPMFIDVGTGSGCIAVTLASERRDARVVATDLSERALESAERNARLHGVRDRISFLTDDLVEHARAAVPSGTRVTIIANLPYLPDGQRRTLCPDVVRHEPALALFGGPDGLGPTRLLIDQIATWTDRPPLELYVELLPEQAAATIAYAKKKMPGLSAEPIVNASDTLIGVRLTAR